MGLRKKTARFMADTIRLAVWKHACRYEETVWVVGDGRSGTTWLSALINSDQTYREMFEPFHPLHASDLTNLPLNMYLQPASGSDGPLPGFTGKVFRGDIYSLWIDRNNRKFRYQRLLIKDVFANLFAAWAAQRFPQVKIVFLIRNPFAVALSKYKKRDWCWMENPADFLKQPKLMADWLEPFRDLLENPPTGYIERQILIWSVLHYVPLRQFASGGVHVAFYENLFRNPAEEYVSLMQWIRPLAGAHPAPDEEVVRSLSCVAGTASTLKNGQSPLHRWKDELPAAEIDNGMKILIRFGLDGLYGGESLPQSGALEEFMHE